MLQYLYDEAAIAYPAAGLLLAGFLFLFPPRIRTSQAALSPSALLKHLLSQAGSVQGLDVWACCLQTLIQS